MTRILGIDPGSHRTGYGVIIIQGQRHEYVAHGAITTQPQQPMGQRLWQIYQGLLEVIMLYQPEEVAIEEIFMHQNPQSALKLGQARGVAIIAAASQDLPLSEYSARQVKQSIVGYGAAEKNQVQHMIKAILKLPTVPQADAADALAIALCHCQNRRFARKLAEATHNKNVPIVL